MEQSKKKPIMVGIVVACLALAGIITYKTGSGGARGLDGIKAGQKVWVKCSDPDCGAEYEIDMKDYFQYVQENMVGAATPPLVCKKCGKKSVFRAVKCAKCGLVFFYNSVPNDFADRCPECRYSQFEVDTKAPPKQ